MKLPPAVLPLAICPAIAIAQSAADPRVTSVQNASRSVQGGKPADACKQLRSLPSAPRDHVWATARLTLAGIAGSCQLQAESIYDEVINTGLPADAALARNNKALLLLDSRRDDEALKLLQQIAAAPPSTPPDPNHAAYRANLGAAYERHKNWDEAIRAYSANAAEGLDLADTTESLARVFVQLAHANPSSDWPSKLTNTVTLLASQGGLAGALTVLEAVAAEPSAAPEHLGVALVIAAGAAPFVPEAADRTVAVLASRSNQAPFVQDLRNAISGDWPAPESTAAAAKLLPAALALPWSSAEGAVRPAAASRGSIELARFLHRIADFYFSAKNHSRALTRYTASWVLDPSDTAAARTTAFLVHDYPNLNRSGSLRELLARTYRPAENTSVLGGAMSLGGKPAAQPLRRAPPTSPTSTPTWA
jgi:tetratricopeptide (TPR) repeat protein